MVVREMNIAVVDDKSKDREEVIQHIMKYKKLNHLDFHITEEQLNKFNKATIVQLFLAQQSQLKDIDNKNIEIVFLDIYMDVLGI